MRGLLVASLALIAAAGCDNKFLAYVDGALLADADGVVPAPAGPTVVVKPETDLAQLALPKAPVIRLAFARDVPFPRVEELVRRVEAAGSKPVLLVGRRNQVQAFDLHEPVTGERTIQVQVTGDGQSCVGISGVPEMRCTQGAGRHVHGAFVREDVREAVKEYQLREVQVRADPTVEWADVIRAIDGARTCCGDTKVRATLVP